MRENSIAIFSGSRLPYFAMFSSSVHFSGKFHNLIFFSAEQHPIMCKYHILFILSSSDGRLRWFHFLANVSRNKHGHTNVSLVGASSKGMCSTAVYMGHVAVLFLAFWGTSILISIVAVSVYIPTNSQ